MEAATVLHEELDGKRRCELEKTGFCPWRCRKKAGKPSALGGIVGKEEEERGYRPYIGHMELLFPLLPPYHVKEMNVSSLHFTDLTSSPESLCFIVCKSRALWIMMVDCHLEIMIVMLGPVSCSHMIVIVVVNHDRGGSRWWTLMAAMDYDDGLWIMVNC